MNVRSSILSPIKFAVICVNSASPMVSQITLVGGAPCLLFQTIIIIIIYTRCDRSSFVSLYFKRNFFREFLYFTLLASSDRKISIHKGDLYYVIVCWKRKKSRSAVVKGLKDCQVVPSAWIRLTWVWTTENNSIISIFFLRVCFFARVPRQLLKWK